MKLLVQIYNCLQNHWLVGYCPQIPVLSSVFSWICWVCHWNQTPRYTFSVISSQEVKLIIMWSRNHVHFSTFYILTLLSIFDYIWCTKYILNFMRLSGILAVRQSPTRLKQCSSLNWRFTYSKTEFSINWKVLNKLQASILSSERVVMKIKWKFKKIFSSSNDPDWPLGEPSFLFNE